MLWTNDAGIQIRKGEMMDIECYAVFRLNLKHIFVSTFGIPVLTVKTNDQPICLFFPNSHNTCMWSASQQALAHSCVVFLPLLCRHLWSSILIPPQSAVHAVKEAHSKPLTMEAGASATHCYRQDSRQIHFKPSNLLSRDLRRMMGSERNLAGLWLSSPPDADRTDSPQCMLPSKICFLFGLNLQHLHCIWLRKDPALHCVSCSRLVKNLLTEKTGLVPSSILQSPEGGLSLSNNTATAH